MAGSGTEYQTYYDRHTGDWPHRQSPKERINSYDSELGQYDGNAQSGQPVRTAPILSPNERHRTDELRQRTGEIRSKDADLISAPEYSAPARIHALSDHPGDTTPNRRVITGNQGAVPEPFRAAEYPIKTMEHTQPPVTKDHREGKQEPDRLIPGENKVKEIHDIAQEKITIEKSPNSIVTQRRKPQASQAERPAGYKIHDTRETGQGPETARPSQGQVIRGKRASILEETPHDTAFHRLTGKTSRVPDASPRAGIIREKPVNRSIKTADRSIRSTQETIKTSSQASHAAAQNARKASQAASTVKYAGKKAEQSVRRKAAKLSREALKAVIAAIKSLKTMQGSGSAVVVLILVVILLVGMLLASPFGIFFRGADDGEMTIQTVIVELNNELTKRIANIENSVPHDDVRRDGHSAAMKDVLAVYAVAITTDPDHPLDAIEMDEERKAVLTEIFWSMNTISYTTETYTEEVTVEVEVEDEDGEGSHTEEQVQTVAQTRLIITISGKTAQEAAAERGFTDVQLRYLDELLSDEYAQLWYGLPMGGSDDIVQVALSQVGNVGGQPYWSWYGFSYRVSWCACFVSWCADQCGYIDAGIVPKFSWCDTGIDWFKARGQWRDRSYLPEPGTIIFFDWDSDGFSDHVGIVEYCDGTYVYTIEGNTSGDMCKQNVYVVGEYDIAGYGVYAGT